MKTKTDPRFVPASGRTVPRYAGVPSFMRLPSRDIDNISDVHIGLFGIPWDGGTSNRPGARMGPRAMRQASSMMRQVNHDTGAAPYHTSNCADLGDAPVNPLSIPETLAQIEGFATPLHAQGSASLSAGGDHLTTLPLLRSVAKAHGPVGLVQFDAHMDLGISQFGQDYAHGTPFRRALEEGLLDPKRIVQIGIRGGFYMGDGFEWAREQGITVLTTEDVRDKGIAWVIEKIAEVIGDAKAYATFDIDCLDPAFAPGTGTPEIGGIDTLGAQLLIRSLRHLNIVSADLVEVAPDLDPSGVTTLTGTALYWELLCVLSQTHARHRNT